MAIQGDGITWGVLLGVLGSYVLSVLASLTAPVWRSAGLSGFRYAAAVRIFYYADRYVRMRAWLARPPLMVVEFVYANFRLTVAVIAILALLAAPVLFPGSGLVAFFTNPPIDLAILAGLVLVASTASRKAVLIWRFSIRPSKHIAEAHAGFVQAAASRDVSFLVQLLEAQYEIGPAQGG
jgi:hypothetical protein